MVTSCSAIGCTYRHKKGDNIGLYRFPTKDEKLCRRWLIAVRRANWKPTSTARICGQHFQTGKPSKDKNHPDYVPNVFVYTKNQNTKEHWQKVAEQKASQRVAEIVHGAPKVDMTGYRRLKPKLEGCGFPFVVRARKADKQYANPAVQSCHFSTMMKKNINGNKKIIEASNNNRIFPIQNEVRPPVPPKVWVLNFDSEKNSSASVGKPIKRESDSVPYTSLKKNFPASMSDSPVMIYENSEPHCVESSVTVSDDDSTLTAESSIPDIYEDDEPSMAVCKNATAILNVDATENASNDSTDSHYSQFKSSPFDTKEILAIKLETMLAVNISLKQKVKFYQNRCRQYEREINNLKNTAKKTETQTIYLM